ncbi:MAG: CPBP family intramembrane metalloprotease [Olsenella sp.]|nr:CPBP family intramembrane metalloprotease [Olsenella sp.]
MKSLVTKYPLLFGFILFFAAMVAAVPVMLVLNLAGLPSDAAGAVGRIVVGLALLLVLRSLIAWDKSLSGLGLAIPVLVIVAWNVVYHLMSGFGFADASAIPGAVLLGLAPGIFEEVIFRGATIGAMREAGKGPWYTLVASSALFAVVHLTNAAGMDLPSVLVQVLYSLVVGLLLGAIYLRSGDIVTPILAHAAIDISNQVFAAHPTTTSVPMLAAFVVVLVVECAYALWLAKGLARDGE